MKVLQFFLGLIRALISFVWRDYSLEVPLGEDIKKYTTKPYVEVYEGSQMLASKNKNITYSIDNSYATFEEINTKDIGSYYVKYIAMYKDNPEFQDEKIVEFKVVDKIKPTYLVKGDLTYDVGRKVSEKDIIKDNFLPSDNYCKIRRILKNDNESYNYNHTIYEYLINYQGILFDQIGEYKFTYLVKDQSDNRCYSEHFLKIVDRVAPTITKIRGLRINMKNSFNVFDFFKFADNYDKVIDNVKVELNANLSIPGNYPIKIIAKDKTGNESVYEDILMVGDNPPELVLAPEIFLEVFDAKYMEKLKEMVIRIDHYSNKYTIDDVKITTNIVIGKLGKYDVLYEVISKIDGSVCDTKKIKVPVLDLKAPTIRLLKNIILPLNSHSFNLDEYIEVEDNYDKKEEIEISKLNKSDYDLNKVGVYYITITATDKSKNKTSLSTYIYVKDVIKPKIELIKELKINYLKKENLKTFFKITDDVTKEGKIEVSFSIDKDYYKRLGKYKLTVFAKDEGGNVESKDFELEIIDTVAPQIKLKYNIINFFIGEEIPNLLDNIESVEDNETKLEAKNCNIVQNYDFTKPGKYEIYYTVYDNSKNLGATRLLLYVDNKQFPSLNLSPLEIDRKDTITKEFLLQGLSDEELKDYKIQIISDIPKDIKEGKYILKYRLTNKRGYVNDYERELTITENKKRKNIYVTIGVVSAIFVASSCTSIFIFKKLAKKSSKEVL